MLAMCMRTRSASERACIFFHHPGAVDFDGPLTHAEFVGDDLVGLARDDEFEDLVFPLRQPLDERLDLPGTLDLGASFFVRAQCEVNPVQQLLVAERLLYEVDRPFLHGLDGHGHVAVAGNEDDRDRLAALQQLVLQFEPAEAGHADVEDLAAGLRGAAVPLEEFVRAVENLVPEFHRFHEGLHGNPDSGVIADDENGGFVVLYLHVGGVSELVGEPVRSTGINYGEARNRTQTPGLPAWPRGPWIALRPCFTMASDLLI